jgi:hypothetical protein
MKAQAENRNGSRGVEMAVPAVAGHPNRVPFAGVLTLVDVPSEKAPAGARGHRVVLRRVAAEAALPSLMGMAVDFTSQWDGHDARAKCGILTHAEIEGHELKVRGYLFGRDYPEVERGIDAHGEGAMGMSYELADAQVADMRASVWQLERVMFTGAAILLRDKAAYRGTSFQLLREDGGPRRKAARRRPSCPSRQARGRSTDKLAVGRS